MHQSQPQRKSKMRVKVTYFDKKTEKVLQSSILTDSTDSILALIGNKIEEFLHGYPIKVSDGKVLSISMKKVNQSDVGNYTGPDKIDKGREGGSCNQSYCQDSPADYYNHYSGAWYYNEYSGSWYCENCRRQIAIVNKSNYNDWKDNYYPNCKHPMFETRAEINARGGLI
jgi:hypothetical protein